MNEWDYLVAAVRDAFARLGCSMANRVRAINEAIEVQRAIDGSSRSTACQDDLHRRSSMEADDATAAYWTKVADPSRDYMPDNIHYGIHIHDDVHVPANMDWWSDPAYSSLPGNYYHHSDTFS